MKFRKEFVTRSAYAYRARKLFLKSFCELCGRCKKLGIHHINRVWSDNRKENIQTLCSSCHTTIHHNKKEIANKWNGPCLHCEKKACKKGMCDLHYRRVMRYGSPDIPKKTENKCFCGEKAYKLKMCNKHYLRFRRHGDPLGGDKFRKTKKSLIITRV